MPLGVAYPFGMRDIKVSAFTNVATETTAASVDLPASRTMTWTEAEDFETLRGDDKNITTRGKGPKINWNLESGGLSLDAYKIMVGGTVTDTGVTPSQTKRFRKLVTEQRPFFKAEGQAMSDNGGDVHTVLFRCRATGDIEGNFEDGGWYATKLSGEAFPSQAAATLDALYDIIYNETVTNIT